MRSELLLVEKIEHYLEGTLSSSDHAAFEKQIASDIELQNEVALQKEIIKGLQRSALKKEVAVAFLKYKKIALLFKLAVIGASAIVGTAVTVAVVHFVNKENRNTSSSTISKYPLTQVDHYVQNDSLLSNKDSLVYFQDSILTEPTEPIVLEHTSNSLENKNAAVTEKNNVLAQNIPPAAKEASNTKEKTTTKKDSVGAALPKATIPVKKSKRTKNSRLADLFWVPGTPITWLGIDFTNIKLLGKFSTLTKDSTKANFKAWNDLIMDEKRKYDLNDAFYTKYVNYSVEHINKRNDSIKAERLFVSNANSLNHLNPGAIQKTVNTYNLEGKEGLGLVFIVESFDKLKEKSTVWIAIIDMSTNEVLLTEKIVANPGGGGLKNYWARGFYNTINIIEEKKYPEWKKKYKK